MNGQANQQVGQDFNWKTVAQSLAQAVPSALLYYGQYRREHPSANPIQAVEQGKQYLTEAKNWLGQFPIIKIGGGLLIADSLISIFTHLGEKKIHHIVRLARAGLGWYIIKKL